jgi:hypothetical protein
MLLAASKAAGTRWLLKKLIAAPVKSLIAGAVSAPRATIIVCGALGYTPLF